MRIIIDLQACQNGSRNRGIGRYSMAIAKAMISEGAGHEFFILISDRFSNSNGSIFSEFRDFLPSQNIIVFTTHEHTTSADSSSAWRSRAAELIRADVIDRLNPDAVFLPSLIEGFWDNMVISIEPRSYVNAVMVHDLIPLTFPDHHMTSECERATYLRKIREVHVADVVLSPSAFVRDEIVRELNFPTNRIVVTGEGADARFSRAEVSEARKAELYRRCGITKPFILNSSPLEYRKNLEGLIAGFSLLSPELRDGHQLVVVGRMNDAGTAYLNRLIVAEGLPEGSLVLTGYLSDEDLIDLYRSTELFVFPSISEGFGLPVLEAMRCGALTIASNASSIPEVLARRDCLFDPLDPADLAAVMTRALTDAEWRKGAMEDQEACSRKLTWPAAARATLLAIEQAVGRRVARPAPQAAIPVQSRLAVVHVSHPKASRATGCIDAILDVLASRYRLTAVMIGEGEVPLWREAAHGAHGLEWLHENSAEFDRILYVGDRADIVRMESVIGSYAGAILLLDDNVGHRDFTYPRRELERSIRIRDLHAEGGYAKAAAASLSAEHAKSNGGSLLGMAHGIIRENGAFEPTSRIIPTGMFPAAVGRNSPKMVREALDIPPTAPIILAHVADDAGATELARAFRTCEASGKSGAFLIILSLEEHTPAQRREALVGSFPGRVERKSRDEYEHYLCYLAAASAVYHDPRIEASVRDRLEMDAAFSGLPSFSTATSDVMMAALTGQLETRPLSDFMADWDLAGHIEQIYDASPLGRYSSLIETIPAEVRGVTASVDDITEVSRALVANEASSRAPRVFIDLTGVTQGAYLRTANPLVATVIRSVLLDGEGPLIEPIRFSGSQFYQARRAVAPLLGLIGDALVDEPADFRSGDRIIGFDVLDPFPDAALPALTRAVDRGARIQCAILGEARATPFICKDILRNFAPDTFDGKSFKPLAASSPNGIGAALESRDLSRRLVQLRTRGLLDEIICFDPRCGLVSDIAVLAPNETLVLGVNAETAHEDDPRGLHYVVAGHMLGSYSLAIVNRAVARTIEGGLPGRVRVQAIETNPTSDLSYMPREERPLIEELASRKREEQASEIVISQHYPVYVPEVANTDVKVALFAHEESRVVPYVVEVLNAGFDAVVAPSTYVAKSLIDSGLRVPVAAIGQPTNLSPFRRIAPIDEGGIFTFLHISSCFPRKGPDVLLEAWARAFQRAERVRLIIKTFPNPHNDIEAQVASLQARYPRVATIEIISEDLDNEGMARIYEQANTVVLPTRGEGYNLPALEAMHMGIPLIVTGQGGHLDFCGDREARLVRFRLEPSRSHVRSALSLWAEPDVNDLAAAFREYADPFNRGLILRRAEHARAAAAAAADRAAWLDRMNQVSRALLAKRQRHRRSPRIAWISTWEVRCGIAQHSEFLFAELTPEQRVNYRMLCDLRTEPDPDREWIRPVWPTGELPQRAILAAEVEAFGADAVVIQHQDGLISWDELARIANDPCFNQRILVIVLHNPRAIAQLSETERRRVLDSLHRASRVIVHNVSDVNLMLSFGLTTNVTMLPPGSIPARYTPDIRTLAPQESGPIIGCHGFAFPHKGFDKLLLAVNQLRTHWPNMRVRMVTAEFPDEKSRDTIVALKALAADLGLADAIEWHTEFLPVEAIIRLLAECDLLVLPYDQSQDSASGAARICLSSLAPTLATRVKIFEEMQDALAGVDNNDPDVLAEAIGRLLSNPAARSAVQERMAKWLSDCSWHQMMELMDGMIEGLFAQREMGWN